MRSNSHECRRWRVLLLGFFRQSSNSPLGSCNSHYINLLLVVKNVFWYFRCWKVIFSCAIFTYSIHSRPTAGLYNETLKWNSHNHILFLKFLSYEIQVLFRISCLQDSEEYIALTAKLFAWELASRNARLQEIWCQFSYRLSQYLPSWKSTELSYDRRSPPSRKILVEARCLQFFRQNFVSSLWKVHPMPLPRWS